MIGRLVVFAVTAILISGSWADWPKYLGPNGNAVSQEKGLAKSWPEAGPKVLWTIPMGEGYGAPVVSKGKIYVHDRSVDDSQDLIRCIDLNSGKEDWSYTYDAPGSIRSYPGSRSLPIVEGNYVYTCGTFGHLYCIDITTHKPVWNKNIWTDFGGGRIPMWGISQNPLIYDDLLIVESQTPEAGAVAYDKKTGKVRWTSPPFPGGRVGYASPKVINICGEEQLIVLSAGPRNKRGRGGRRRPRGNGPRGSLEQTKAIQVASLDTQPLQLAQRPSGPMGGVGEATVEQVKGLVLGLDPKTGKTLWTYDGWQCQTPIPNVVEIGDGRLFITGGYNAGSAMFKVDKKDGKYVVTEIYKTKEFGVHVHPPVLYKGHFYGHCSDNSHKDGMVCMDIDGKIKWKTMREPLFDKGGFILADDMILSIDGSKGVLYLIDPSPKGFKPLSSAKLLDTNKCWAPLALVDGKLLIRDQKQMKCVYVR
jgi:outer membrane protein assembly factor BamB